MAEPVQSAEFKKAAEDVKKLKEKPKDDQRKELYGLFKHGTEPAGSWKPKKEEKEEPSWFNFLEHGKYFGRKAVYEQGLTPEQAQEKYVELVQTLIKKHGINDP